MKNFIEKRQLHHRLEVEPDFDSYSNESHTERAQKNGLTTTETTTHSISNLMIIFCIASPSVSSFSHFIRCVLNMCNVFFYFVQLLSPFCCVFVVLFISILSIVFPFFFNKLRRVTLNVQHHI